MSNEAASSLLANFILFKLFFLLLAHSKIPIYFLKTKVVFLYFKVSLVNWVPYIAAQLYDS